MSDSIAMGVHAPAGQRMPWRWLGSPVTRYRGKVGTLRGLLPTFQRESGRCGKHEIRGIKGSRRVGNVSPYYVLVQHNELLDALPEVLSDKGYGLNDLHGELLLAGNGERMELVIDLPSVQAMPSDGFPLSCRLRCVNSVDRSTAIEAELQWYRQVCSNGMFGWAGEKVRRVHRFDNALNSVQNRLRQRFDRLYYDRDYFESLMRMPVRWNNLQDWADVFVARKWGKQEAARVLHICRTGKDAIVAPGFDPDFCYEVAHELDVVSTVDVPGACAPVTNIYHVGQALSWVAAGANTLHTQFSRTAGVPLLLGLLID